MARLIVHLDIDVDPSLADPEELAELVLDWDYQPTVDVAYASWDA